MQAQSGIASMPAGSNRGGNHVTSSRPLSLLTRLRLPLLALSLATAAQAVELDPAGGRLSRRPISSNGAIRPTRPPPTRPSSQGDPTKPGSLYIHINKFKPGRFGNAHYHPNDRYITVIDGAAWRGTGTVVDPAHATRVPKGTFMIDHANKVHWDGTKEESGAYLITGIGPATNIEDPESRPARGRAAIRQPRPSCCPTRSSGRTTAATRPRTSPAIRQSRACMCRCSPGRRATSAVRTSIPNDRYIYVLDGTWWVGTGNKFDPGQPDRPDEGRHLRHALRQGRALGRRQGDEDATILIIGEGPATNTRVEEAK